MEEMDVKDDSVASFSLHKDAVHCVAINPTDETMIISGSQDDTSFIWKSDGKELFQLKGHTDTVISVGFSFDGKYAATASMDATVRVYNTSTGKLVHILTGPSKEIMWMEWHMAGHVILAGDADNSVWLWNAQTGKVMTVLMGHKGPVTCGSFSHDGKMIVSAKIGRAVQQECRDRSRMPSSA
eukprot:TRINITY_DN9585_c0_g1_i7.p1 TRINITY_DN9585_c0_g1~~TRINITY_DN9585_c0_g1_i7.p1  ORF type:complete len:183 (+),score=28.16 TRINITY_DN9585_c0_g1_i7:410-958(+)